MRTSASCRGFRQGGMRKAFRGSLFPVAGCVSDGLVPSVLARHRPASVATRSRSFPGFIQRQVRAVRSFFRPAFPMGLWVLVGLVPAICRVGDVSSFGMDHGHRSCLFWLSNVPLAWMGMVLAAGIPRPFVEEMYGNGLRGHRTRLEGTHPYPRVRWRSSPPRRPDRSCGPGSLPPRAPTDHVRSFPPPPPQDRGAPPPLSPGPDRHVALLLNPTPGRTHVVRFPTEWGST